MKKIVLWILFIVFSNAQDLYLLQENNKWGFVNEKCQWVIPAQFDKSIFYGKKSGKRKLNVHYLEIKKGNKYGIIDRKGKWIISPILGIYKYKFYYSPFLDDINKFDKFRVVVNNKRGLMNREGKWIIKPKFKWLGRIHNNLLIAKYNHKWGIINIKEKWIIYPKYEDIDYLDNSLYSFKINHKWGIYDIQKNIWIIKPKFEYIDIAHKGITIVEQNNKQGLFDVKNNKWVVKPKFKDCFYNDFNSNNKVFICSINNKKTFLNLMNNKISNINDTGRLMFFDGISTYRIKNKKCGYIDVNGKIIKKAQFDECDIFRKGIAAVKLNNKMGFINKKGEYIVKPILDNNYNLYSDETDKFGRIIIKLNGKYGVIDKKGKIVVKPIYTQLFYKIYKNKLFFIVGVKDRTCIKYGILDSKGKFLMKPYICGEPSIIFEKLVIDIIDDKLAIVKVNYYTSLMSNIKKGYYLYSLKNHRIIKRLKNIVDIDIKNNFILFKSHYNGKWGIINKYGNILRNPIIKNEYSSFSGDSRINFYNDKIIIFDKDDKNEVCLTKDGKYSNLSELELIALETENNDK